MFVLFSPYFGPEARNLFRSRLSRDKTLDRSEIRSPEKYAATCQKLASGGVPLIGEIA